MSNTQASTSSNRTQSKRRTQRIEDDIIDLNSWSKIKDDVLTFILNNSISKIPIKKSDITLHALDGNHKILQQVLKHIQKDLIDIYGIDILEVPDTKSVKSYITVSKVSGTTPKNFTAQQNATVLLLFLILSYIFMKGFAVNEDVIFRYLAKLRIYVDDDHDFFGPNLKKLITDTFVKQLYLKREKIQVVGASENEYVLSWGFRSYSEFPKKLVLEAVAAILHKPSICFFQQHMEVHGETNEEDDEES